MSSGPNLPPKEDPETRGGALTPPSEVSGGAPDIKRDKALGRLVMQGYGYGLSSGLFTIAGALKVAEGSPLFGSLNLAAAALMAVNAVVAAKDARCGRKD